MYNKIILIGNLTRDIELRYLPSSAAIAKGAIATTYKFKSASGEQKEEVCFLDFNVFGRSAEVANQYLKKGSKVYVIADLKQENWTANDGQNKSKHTLKIDSFEMLDSKPTDGQNSQGNQYQAKKEPAVEYQNSNIPEIDINDEVPFNRG